jgi:hypothetical protein
VKSHLTDSEADLLPHSPLGIAELSDDILAALAGGGERDQFEGRDDEGDNDNGDKGSPPIGRDGEREPPEKLPVDPPPRPLPLFPPPPAPDEPAKPHPL